MARSGTKTVARLVAAAADIDYPRQYFALGPNDVPPGNPTDLAQAVLHEVGRGRSAYFAADITGVYGKFGYPTLRRLLANAVNWAARGANPVVAHAPLGVEVRAYRQGSRTIVQLASYVASQVRGHHNIGGPAIEETIPIHDIRLELKSAARRAFAASSGAALPLESAPGKTIVRLPRLDGYEIVVVE